MVCDGIHHVEVLRLIKHGLYQDLGLGVERLTLYHRLGLYYRLWNVLRNCLRDGLMLRDGLREGLVDDLRLGYIVGRLDRKIVRL